MRLDPNFSEFFELLHAREARFLVVGGYAVGLHVVQLGYPPLRIDLLT